MKCFVGKHVEWFTRLVFPPPPPPLLRCFINDSTRKGGEKWADRIWERKTQGGEGLRGFSYFYLFIFSGEKRDDGPSKVDGPKGRGDSSLFCQNFVAVYRQQQQQPAAVFYAFQQVRNKKRET